MVMHLSIRDEEAMKYCLVLLFCGSAFAAPSNIETPSQHIEEIFKHEIELLFKNPIDKMWEEALEYIRALLKHYEPFAVPDMPEQMVNGNGVSLKAKFKNVKISKASDFTIDHIENHVIGLWAKFNVTIPQMHIEGDYTVSGTINGSSVTTSNDGHFVIDIDELKTGGYVKISFKGTYLEMSELDLGYTIKGLKFDETGLKVDGMTEEDIKKLFSDSAFLKYFQDNEEFVCKQVSNYTREVANKIMYNKSLRGLLKWLKDVIDGKVIPTPPAMY